MHKNKQHDCSDCGASYKLKYDLDDCYYRATYCPFCGYQNEDSEYIIEEVGVDEDED